MSISPPNIFLIGPMGSGKTTIGKRLASMLKLDFYDCDQEIEKVTGASVNLIFDVEGEKGFRKRETRLLEDLTARNNVLISTGGGVVCKEVNRQLLRSRGFVVFLKTNVKSQLNRLSHDKSRPLLQTENKTQRLQDLAQVRDPLYDATADLTFKTRDQSVFRTATALAAAIQEQVGSFRVLE